MTPSIAWLVSTRVAADLLSLVYLKGSLILGALLLAHRLAARRSAAFRHSIWLVGLCALIAVPVLELALPAWGESPLRYPSETALVGLEAIELGRGPTPESVPTPGIRDSGPDEATALLDTEPASAPVADPPDTVPALTFLLLAWWVGALLAATRMVSDVVRATVFRVRASPVDPSHPAARLLEAERKRLSLRRSVSLLVVPRSGLAATVGTVRPVVALGHDVVDLPEEQLRPVILHELAHVRRRDYFVNLLGSLAGLLYWAHPLFQLARREARLLLEQACDDEVLHGGVRSSAYASVLMRFAVARPAPGPAMRSSLGLLTFSPTRDRIHSVLDDGVDRARVAPRSSLTMWALAATLVLPLGSLGVLSHTPGTGSTQALIEALADQDPAVRARAAATLERRDPAPARPQLERLLDDPSADVRLAAASALDKLADPRSLSALTRVLERPFDGGRGEHGYVLKLAMTALGSLDTPDAVRVLEAQLDRPVPQLRWLALEQITNMPTHHRAALPHLARFAESDPDPRNRRLASAALERLSR